MNSASYSNIFIDVRLTGTGFEFELQRAYRSRTLYNGLFGFGWCSNLETRLLPVSDDEIVMLDCGDGMLTNFVREASPASAGNDVHIRERRLSAAMDRLGFDETARRGVLDTVSADMDLTSFEKFELGAGSRKLPLGKFLSSTGERLESTLSGVSSNADRDTARHHSFDAWGRLRTYTTPGGELVQIEHLGMEKLRIRVRHNQIDLILDPMGRQVLEIWVNGEKRATYEYTDVLHDGARLLLANTNQWGGRYSYQYTEYRNLIRIEWPDASSISVDYDDEKDWAMAFTDRDGCREDYTYSFSAAAPEGFSQEGAAITEALAPFRSAGVQWTDDPKYAYWAGVEKDCGSSIVARNAYYFVHSRAGASEEAPVLLALVATHTSGKSRAMAYSEPSGEVTVSTYPLKSVFKVRVSNSSPAAETYIGSFGQFRTTRAPNQTYSACRTAASVTGRFTLFGKTFEVETRPEFDSPADGVCDPDRLIVIIGGNQVTLKRSGHAAYSAGTFVSSINVANREFLVPCLKAGNLPLTESIEQVIAGNLSCSAEERALLVLAVFETFGIY
ncbi:MAG TPA: hypothetical protein DCY26_12355 [Hyphomonas sp.]|nr:hypothetical protein [Hyphomonas sp.]